MMRRLIAIPFAALGIGLLGAGSAGAEVVTVGSPLKGTFTQQNFSGALSLVNLTIPEAGAHATSPVTGVLVRWRVTVASGGPFRLRVLTPVGGHTYRGAGTSEPQIPSSTAIQTFPTSLPIAAGQTIAIDSSTSGDHLGGAKVPGSSLAFWIPPLADAATTTATAGYSGTEVGFNADVATDAVGKAKLNRRKGTASLSVGLPGPGTVVLRGNSVRSDRVTRAGAGKVKLLVRTKGPAKHRLARSGKAKVKVKVRYAPAGALSGAANVQRRTIKLVKR
jgi:hypothetical protein